MTMDFFINSQIIHVLLRKNAIIDSLESWSPIAGGPDMALRLYFANIWCSLEAIIFTHGDIRSHYFI